MNKGAEDAVLLRRPPDTGKRPDGVGPVIDGIDRQHGKIVLQPVLSEVIAERSLGQEFIRDNGAGNAEIGFRPALDNCPALFITARCLPQSNS